MHHLRNMSECARRVYRVVHRRIFDQVVQKVSTAEPDLRLTGRISTRNALLLLFFKMLTACSNMEIEERFGFPHSNFHQVVSRLRKLVSEIAEAEVTNSRTWQQRLEAGQLYVPPNETDLAGATMIIDGHHIVIETDSHEPDFNHNFWSYKKHAPGISIQVIISVDEYIIYVSPAFRAAQPDISCTTFCREHIHASLQIDSREKVVADKGFVGMELTCGIRTIVPDKKPRGGELQRWQFRRNASIERFRGARIERVFGYLNSNFSLLRRPIAHRGHPGVAREWFLIACLIYNMQLSHNS